MVSRSVTGERNRKLQRRCNHDPVHCCDSEKENRMNSFVTRFLPLVLLLSATGLLVAQGAKPETPKNVSQVLDRAVAGAEREFVPAVEAMPEDKFAFAPSSGEFKGVRTFAQQAKHVAAVNYLVGSAILGEKPPIELGGENGPDSV